MEKLMKIEDFIRDLDAPDTQSANFLRGNMNTLMNSMIQSIGNYGGAQGWGGNSGMLGKMITGNVTPAVSGGMAQGLADLESARLPLLLQALLGKEDIDLRKQEANQGFWGSIGGGFGAGLGNVLSNIDW